LKTKLVIAGILVANALALWWLAHRYEFHTGMSGAVMWRCNRLTGNVEHTRFGDSFWVAVADRPTWESTTPLPDKAVATKREESIPDWAKDDTLGIETNKAVKSR
jgi:hypothetical protein